jgi:hypothetical protein
MVGCATGPPDAEVARQIEKLRATASVAGESTHRARHGQAFPTRARASKPAWLDRADDIVKAIQGMRAEGLDPADYHLGSDQSKLEKRSHGGERGRPHPLLADSAVARMADDVRYGRVRP